MLDSQLTMTLLWLLLGVVSGALFVAYTSRFGRAERKVLASGVVVAALVYIVFALWAREPLWLGIEALGTLAYGALARLGVRRSALWLALAWLLHPVWDVGLHLIGPGREVAPAWYALACLNFDVLVAGYIFVKFRQTGAEK